VVIMDVHTRQVCFCQLINLGISVQKIDILASNMYQQYKTCENCSLEIKFKIFARKRIVAMTLCANLQTSHMLCKDMSPSLVRIMLYVTFLP
jgi:hypothetical protein